MEDIKRAIAVHAKILWAAGNADRIKVFNIKKAEISNRLDTIVDPEYCISPDIRRKNIGIESFMVL